VRTFRISSLFQGPADYLTASRILLSLPLPWTAPASPAFYVLYTLAGLTDMLDGPVARKTHTVSRNGAMLDSVADAVFLITALIALLPVLVERFPAWTLWPILTAAALRCGSYGVGAYKYRRFVAYHTQLNKLAGAALYGLPYLMPLWKDMGMIWVVLCVLVCVSAGEELLIQMLSKHLNLDVQSVFDLKRRDSHV
jgi:CDP-diacylglycerol--glycerol-3-phosphate 3-phosphatidyltransferase